MFILNDEFDETEINEELNKGFDKIISFEKNV